MGQLILVSNCGFVLGRIQNNTDLLPCPRLTLNFILIFTLFNRFPERLEFPACLFLLNLFSFPHSLTPYPSFVSVPFSSSCFTFSFNLFPPSVPEGLCDLSLQLLYMGLCYSLWPLPQLDALTEKYACQIFNQCKCKEKNKHSSIFFPSERRVRYCQKAKKQKKKQNRCSSLGKDIECMQILLVDVYRSQVGCRHLLPAHSGQTHAANPQA